MKDENIHEIEIILPNPGKLLEDISKIMAKTSKGDADYMYDRYVDDSMKMVHVLSFLVTAAGAIPYSPKSALIGIHIAIGKILNILPITALESHEALEVYKDLDSAVGEHQPESVDDEAKEALEIFSGQFIEYYNEIQKFSKMLEEETKKRDRKKENREVH